ncbi:MAG: AAA family ATPase [Gemmatimonadota bacterium]|nr:AAA family ATPase [Gemmatimonadota bacterium]MDH4349805.1 AAA family ATPase [Gemmatimonadota bacterium]
MFDAAGRELRVRSKKQLGVLLYLVMDGRDHPVSRDVLMEAFWEGVSRERAYHSLCQAVTAIRGVLGREAVVSRGQGLLLTVPVETDIDALSTDHERGDLLHPLREMEWLGGSELGHWVERSREHCRRRAEAALRSGIEAHRRAGATLRVHRCATLLYELDGLSEPAALALAERELLRGDVVGAIRFLRHHLRRVSETLGCQPQAAPERLLRRLEAGAHPPVELVPKRLAAHAARVRPTVLVARERELSHLEGEWQQVHQAPAFRSCIVTGPGGIGKSSLIRRFAATVAGRAQTVFVVSCQEMGEGIPFAAVADLVATLLRDPSVSATDPLWLAEVSRIQPAVRSQYPGVPDPMESPPEAVRVRIAEGVTRMIAAITDGAPLALLFDDLQYMDPATRDVLAVLCRRAQQLPLFLVGTARSIGMESGLPSGPLGRESVPWTSSLRLGPLSPDGTRTLVSTLAPALPLETPVIERRIVELSEGNPQFVEMLLADWQQYASASLAAGRVADELPSDWRPPESLRHAFAKLYAGLDDTTQQLLHMLAVVQRALTPEEVAGAIDCNPTVLDQAALELLTRGILRLDKGALCFKNELHRAYVYFAIPEQVQKYHHGKFARYLLQTPGTPYRYPQLEAARHLAIAGDRATAQDLILCIAPQAIESGAPVEAERVIRFFLSQGTSPDFYVRLRLFLAQSLAGQGRYMEALTELDDFGNESVLGTEDLALYRTLRAICFQRTRSASDDVVLAECRRALSAATDAAIEGLIAIASQVTIEAASEASDDKLIQETVERVRRLAQHAGAATTKARTLATEAFCLMETGDFRRALGVFRESSTVLRSERLDSELARSLNGQGICAMAVGEHRPALDSFMESMKVAERLQDTDHRITVVGNIGLAYEETGLFDEAWVQYLNAVELSKKSSNPRRSALAYANAAHFGIVLGEWDLANDWLEQARAAIREGRLRSLSSLVDFTEADLHLATHEPELAWRLVPGAISSRNTRMRVVDNNGKASRLTMHWLLATKGPSELMRHFKSIEPRLTGFRLGDRLEITAFLAWFCAQYGERLVDGSSVMREIQRAGVEGVLGILRAVGTTPAGDEDALPGRDPRLAG